MSESYGYVCVSDKSQSEREQLLKLGKFDIAPERVFTDYVESFRSKRQGLQQLKENLKSGDRLYIVSLDRLGKSWTEVGREWEQLTSGLGVRVSVIDTPLVDTGDKENEREWVVELVQQLLNSVAADERARHREPQLKGLTRAMERGIHIGRPSCREPEDFGELLLRLERREISVDDACKKANMSRATFYRHKQAYERKQYKNEG